MKRDLELIRSMLLAAEASEDRWFEIGLWQWTDHDMRETELVTDLPSDKLYALDLMEQGGLIRKVVCEYSDVQSWEITWSGFEFLDAVRSEKLWAQLKQEAKAQGIALTVSTVVAGATALAQHLLITGLKI